MKTKQQPPLAGQQTVAVNKPRRLLYAGWFCLCGLMLSNPITVPAATILAATATTSPSEGATSNTQPRSSATLQSAESIPGSDQLVATPITTDPVPVPSVTATVAKLDEQAQADQGDHGTTASTEITESQTTETPTPVTSETDQVLENGTSNFGNRPSFGERHLRNGRLASGGSSWNIGALPRWR